MNKLLHSEKPSSAQAGRCAQGVALFFFVMNGLHVSASWAAEPSPAATASTSPQGAAIVVPLAPNQIKVLEREFNQTLAAEIRALEHQMTSEAKALKSSQRIREREWMAREKQARKEFFKENQSGRAKANWMADRRKRYDEFRGDLKKELARFEKDRSHRRGAALADQKVRREKFKQALAVGQVPETSLWHATRSEPELQVPLTEGTPIPAESKSP